jgi:hypothetical protein
MGPKDTPGTQRKRLTRNEVRAPKKHGAVGERRVEQQFVSMTQAPHTYELPHHHVRARSVESNENEVYELKIDYKFHLIKLRVIYCSNRYDYISIYDGHTCPLASQQVREESIKEDYQTSEISFRYQQKMRNLFSVIRLSRFSRVSITTCKMSPGAVYPFSTRGKMPDSYLFEYTSGKWMYVGLLCLPLALQL